MKVLLRNQMVEGDMKEVDTDMMSSYPHLFSSIHTITWGI